MRGLSFGRGGVDEVFYFVEVYFEQGVADVVGLREIVGGGGVCYGDAFCVGGFGGGDAAGCVLYDCAALGGDADSVCGEEEYLWVGLFPGYVSSGYVGHFVVGDLCTFEDRLGHSAGAGSCYCESEIGSLQGVFHKLEDAGKGGQGGGEDKVDEIVLAELDGAGELVVGEAEAVDFGGGEDVCLGSFAEAGFEIGGFDALYLEEVFEDLDGGQGGRGFGVCDDAVNVEYKAV